MNDYMFQRMMSTCFQAATPKDQKEMTAIIKRTMDKMTATRLLRRLEEII